MMDLPPVSTRQYLDLCSRPSVVVSADHVPGLWVRVPRPRPNIDEGGTWLGPSRGHDLPSLSRKDTSIVS